MFVLKMKVEMMKKRRHSAEIHGDLIDGDEAFSRAVSFPSQMLFRHARCIESPRE